MVGQSPATRCSEQHTGPNSTQANRGIPQNTNTVQTAAIVNARAPIKRMLRPTRASWRTPWSRHRAHRWSGVRVIALTESFMMIPFRAETSIG